MKKLSLQEWRARPKNTLSMYPSMYTMEYLVTTAGLREYGGKLNSIICVMTEKECEILLESKDNYKKIGQLLTNKFKKEPAYLSNLVAWSESQKNSLVNFINDNLNKKIISSLSNKQVAQRYKEYVGRYITYHLKNTPAWWIAPPIVDREIRKYFSEHNIKSIDKVLDIITAPLEYASESFMAEISILDIAVGVKKRGIKSLNKLSELLKEELEKFRALVKEYSSVPFGYNTGVVWSDRHFLNELNKALKINPLKVKNLKTKVLSEKIKKRDKLFISLNLPSNISNLVIALRQVSYLQELKKTTQTKSHPLLQLVVKKEIAKRLELKKEYIDYLTLDEVVMFLSQGKVTEKIRKELKERAKFCVHIIKEKKRTWLLGKEAREFIELNEIMKVNYNLKEINGFVASRGRAIGKVKICESSREINKVEKGDILVTAMTTPDFVPAIRRAAAIITNEGGVTCHAAIISRELNKPCIIGTKIATKVLHDGDIVEVDAKKGIVRIIKLKS